MNQAEGSLQELPKKQKSSKRKLVGLFFTLSVVGGAITASVLLAKKDISIGGLLLNKGSFDVREFFDGAPKSEEVLAFSVFEESLHPIYSNPKRLVISSVGIKADVNSVGVSNDGVMETPDKWTELGWYTKSAKPGEERNVVINGHYDTDSGSPAVFYDLANVKEGDLVEVRDDYGRIFPYKVVELSYVEMKDPERLSVIEDEEGKSTLTMITCGGIYHPTTGYNKRLVVRAELLNDYGTEL